MAKNKNTEQHKLGEKEQTSTASPIREQSPKGEVDSAFFTAVLNASETGLITVWKDGTIRDINREAARMLGWRATDAVGRPLGDVYSPLESVSGEPASLPALAQVLEDGLPFSRKGQLTICNVRGCSLFFTETIVPVYTDQNAPIGAVIALMKETPCPEEGQSSQRLDGSATGMLAGYALPSKARELLETAANDHSSHAVILVDFDFDFEGSYPKLQRTWNVISAVAERYLRRPSAFCYRWTSFRCIILMPYSTLPEVFKLMKAFLRELQKEMDSQIAPDGRGKKVRLSAGVLVFDSQIQDIDALKDASEELSVLMRRCRNTCEIFVSPKSVGIDGFAQLQSEAADVLQYLGTGPLV